MWIPIRRLLARAVDQILIAFLIDLIPGVDGFSVAMLFLSYIIMIPLESVLLTRFGQTPGKFIFRLRVISVSGSLPTLSIALRRSFWVWLAGQAAGISPLQLVATIVAYVQLTKRGSTVWDRKAGTDVVTVTPANPSESTAT
jgi:uncharacterized RDD family membrane protein YckC